MTNFYTIPVDFNLPGSFAEFNSDKAQRGSAGFPHKILLLGHKTTEGTATLNVPVLVSNGGQEQLFGKKSMLRFMFDEVFKNNPYQEAYALPIDEPKTGSQTVWKIDCEGTNVVTPSDMNLYFYGQRVAISIEGNAVAVVGQIKDALEAKENLPIANIEVNDSIVSFAYIHKGASFNHETPMINATNADRQVEGLKAGITTKTAGSGEADEAVIAASLGDTGWTEIVNPFSRNVVLINLLSTILKVRDAGTQQKPGMQFLVRKDNYSNMVTFAQSRDSRFETILGIQDSITPEYVIAAIYAAKVSFETTQDPARPLQYLPLGGVGAAPFGKAFSDTERNILIGKGISTASQGRNGQFLLERGITSYKTSDSGAADDSFQDLEIFYIINLLRYEMNNRLSLRYPRVKIGNNDDALRVGVVRPKDVKAEILALAQEWNNRGLINSIEMFKDNLDVKRDLQNSGRIVIALSPELIGQLRQIFISIQFLR